MSRIKGLAIYTANFEVLKTAPLDARLVVDTYSDLFKPETWKDAEGKVWLYAGIVVSTADLGELYILTEPKNYTITEAWKKISASELESTNYDDIYVRRDEADIPFGYPKLDSAGKIQPSLLPSYVSLVQEYESIEDFPEEGVSDTIYIDKSNYKSYRWTGSIYVEISKSVVIGSTTGTAYDGGFGYDNMLRLKKLEALVGSDKVNDEYLEDKEFASIIEKLDNLTTWYEQ